jgi:hypothetical protein
MIEDDADPETLDAWYRRTPDEIEAAKRAKWNAEWAALRLPDHLAYEPENAAATLAAQAAAGQATDAAATVGRAVRPSRPVPPPKNDCGRPPETRQVTPPSFVVKRPSFRRISGKGGELCLRTFP